MERCSRGSARSRGQAPTVGDGERGGDGEGFCCQDEEAEGAERGCWGGKVFGGGALEGVEGGGCVGWVGGVGGAGLGKTVMLVCKTGQFWVSISFSIANPPPPPSTSFLAPLPQISTISQHYHLPTPHLRSCTYYPKPSQDEKKKRLLCLEKDLIFSSCCLRLMRIIHVPIPSSILNPKTPQLHLSLSLCLHYPPFYYTQTTPINPLSLPSTRPRGQTTTQSAPGTPPPPSPIPGIFP